MTMDRRSFLKNTALGVAAAAWWIEAPTLARAKESGHLVPRAVRPPNYEAVRKTFTMRVTPLERFYLRNHFDVPEVDVRTWRLSVAGAVFAEPILVAMKTPRDSLLLAITYTRVIFYGLPWLTWNGDGTRIYVIGSAALYDVNLNSGGVAHIGEGAFHGQLTWTP